MSTGATLVSAFRIRERGEVVLLSLLFPNDSGSLREDVMQCIKLACERDEDVGPVTLHLQPGRWDALVELERPCLYLRVIDSVLRGVATDIGFMLIFGGPVDEPGQAARMLAELGVKPPQAPS